MIGRFWHWLTDAHRHEWETIRQEPYNTYTTPMVGNKLLEEVHTGSGTLYTLRCKTCGDITTRRAGVGAGK